jgi:hypothetical protein
VTETLFWTSAISGWLVATAVGIAWRLWWLRKRRLLAEVVE